MKTKGNIGIGLITTVILLVSGCKAIGPRTIIRDRVDYASVLSDSWKEQMLLNIVKLRYGDVPVFLDVAATDVTEKRVNPGFINEVVDGVSVHPLVKISGSSQRPDDAFVAVPYHKNWFWIDNKDLFSKQVFSFLMFSFALVETGGKEGTPIVTVPVR